MKKTLIVLLLLSLGLAACIVEPGGGYRDHGWNNGEHAEYHADQGDHGNWGR